MSASDKVSIPGGKLVWPGLRRMLDRLDTCYAT